MENIKLIIKGIVIGFGKIIPGVSGAMLAITLGVYEQGIKILGNITKELHKNLQFIFFLGIGILMAIVFGSKIIIFCLNNYYLATMMLFIGMLIGGIKPVLGEIKNEKISAFRILISLSVVIVLLLLSLFSVEVTKTEFNRDINSLIIFFIGGLMDATATVIPGISGTALLMLLGYYNIIMFAFSDIFNFVNLGNNLFILIPFMLGMIVGVIYISKIMNWLLKKYKTNTYYAIIGFVFASIILLFLQTLGGIYSYLEIIISILMLIIGFIFSLKLDE